MESFLLEGDLEKIFIKLGKKRGKKGFTKEEAFVIANEIYKFRAIDAILYLIDKELVEFDVINGEVHYIAKGGDNDQ